MFLKKSSADEFFTSLEENLSTLDAVNQTRSDNRTNDAIVYLTAASELLNKAGFQEESAIIKVLANEVKGDDASKGLSSEKMLENLETKGWVFNADDGEYQNSEDDSVEE